MKSGHFRGKHFEYFTKHSNVMIILLFTNKRVRILIIIVFLNVILSHCNKIIMNLIIFTLNNNLDFYLQRHVIIAIRRRNNPRSWITSCSSSEIRII